MANDALPCIRCGQALKNVMPEFTENQPSGGTAFETYGHYGSTVFDPMDGSTLEINICDDCLVEAGTLGMLVGKPKRMIVSYLDSPVPMHVGWERLNRPMVPWQKGLPGYSESATC